MLITCFLFLQENVSLLFEKQAEFQCFLLLKMGKKSGCSINTKMGIHFYFISSTHCQRKKDWQLIILTFHVADTYSQIYDLIGKFCKTCCDFFFFSVPTESNYWLLPKSSVTSVNTLLHLRSVRVMLYVFFSWLSFKSKIKDMHIKCLFQFSYR